VNKLTYLSGIGDLIFYSFFQTATVFATDNGLKVTVEEAKCVLANAFIQASVFQQFTLRQEQATFRINLTVLMVCHGYD